MIHRLLVLVIFFTPSNLLAQADQSAVISSSKILVLIGKLHPVFVHFPITLIVIGTLVELSRLLRGKQLPSRISQFCFQWGCVAGVAALAAGWINAWHGEFHGSVADTLELHRWLSIAAVVLASLAALLATSALRRPNRRVYLSYVATGTFASGLIGVAAHYGGAMVHGDDYYSEIFRVESETAKLAKSLPEGELVRISQVQESMVDLPPPSAKPIDFRKDVYPILKRSCYRCHGGGKDKGDYRIDSREDFIRSGEKGPAVVPGRSDLSYVIKLVAGLEPDEIMPEKGRKLTPSEIGVLRAFIDQQVPWDESGKSDALLRARLNLIDVTLPDDQKNTHPLDSLVGEYFKLGGNKLPEVVSDAVFARRASLDVTGWLPSIEDIQALEQSTAPNKRNEYVRSLLEDNKAYADNWLAFWNDLLRNDYSGAGFIGGNRKQITGWLRRALVKNIPYDQFVRELVAPGPRADGFIRGIMWKGGAVNPNERVEMQAAQNIGQVFLGINLKCASCHDSFTDEWTLEDAYGLANIYAKNPLEVHECDKPTGKVVDASFIFPEIGEISKGLDRKQRMKEFAKLLTQDKNGRFVRTIVNRIWGKLLGRGVISPVDEMGHEPWSLEVLDWLAKDFIESGYDLKHLIAQIMTSKAYQLPAVEVDNIDSEDFVFEGPLVRKLSAEQFVDNFARVTGAWVPFDRSDIQRIAQFSKEKRSRRKHEKNMSAFTELREIIVDVSGAKTLWLVTNAREKNKRGNNPFTGSGIWGNPRLIKDGKETSLAALKWTQAFSKRTEPGENPAEFVQKFQLGEEVFAKALSVIPFSVVRYDLGGQEFDELHATIGVSDPKGVKRGKDKAAKLEFIVLSDLDARSAYFAENPVMNALGRPNREQVVSRRQEQLNTMQALMFANGREASKMFRDAASSLLTRDWQDSTHLVEYVFEEFLGRSPTQGELARSLEMIGKKTPSKQGIEDFIWALVLLPEFQLIV